VVARSRSTWQKQYRARPSTEVVGAAGRQAEDPGTATALGPQRNDAGSGRGFANGKRVLLLMPGTIRQSRAAGKAVHRGRRHTPNGRGTDPRADPFNCA
jgi:hypothetical protein